MADWFETNSPPPANDWFSKNDPANLSQALSGWKPKNPQPIHPSIGGTNQPIMDTRHPIDEAIARWNQPGIDPKLKMMSDLVRGVGTAAGIGMAPMALPFVYASPLTALTALGVGAGVQQGSEKIGEMTGHPGAGALAGDVLGGAAGYGTIKGLTALKSVPGLRRILVNAVPYYGKNVVNPILDAIYPESVPRPPGKGTGTKYGGPTEPNYTTPPARPKVTRWIPPVEPEPTPPTPPTPYKAKPGVVTKFGGPTEPNYTVPPPQRVPPRFIPPVEPEPTPPTPYKAKPGIVTKYGGPTEPRYTTPPQRIVPPRFEPPVEPEPTPPEPFKVKPGLVRKLGGAPAGSQYGTSSGGGSSRVTRIQPINPKAVEVKAVEESAAKTAPGSITIPPVEGRSPRYGEIGSTGGQMQSGMAFTKDGAVAQYLKSKNVSPEMWSKLSLDEKNAHISAAGKAIGKNFKPLGKGGVLGRPAEAGSKDIENMLNQVWEK